MLLILSSVGLDYLFTPEQKVYRNCYDQSTRLEYNRNINQIVIFLNPVNKDCQSLPKNLHVDLIIRAKDMPLQRILLKDFNYSVVTNLTFQNVPPIVGLDFAILYIYSYADIAQVNILQYQEQKSDLDFCYQPNSTLRIFKENVTISLTSTLACTQQITTVVEGAVTINELTQVYLLVQGERIDLDVSEFANNYVLLDEAVKHTYTQLYDLLHIQELCFVTADIYFVALQQESEVTFIHTIGQVIIMGNDWKGTTFYGIRTQHAGLWDRSFVAQVNNNLLFTSIGNILSKITFTHYTFRLSIKLGQEIWSKQITHYSSVYNNLLKIYSFSCLEGSPDEQEQCQIFYDKVKDTNLTPICYFETLFYDGDLFLFNEQTSLNIYNTCWRSGILDLKETSLCLQVILQENMLVCDQFIPVGEEFQANVSVSIIMTNSPMIDLVVPLKQTLSRQVREYCISCDELQIIDDCPTFIDQIAKQKSIFYKVVIDYVMRDQSIQKLAIITKRVTFTNYKLTKILVFTTGSAFILACCIMSIMGIVLVVKTIKNSKKKRKNH